MKVTLTEIRMWTSNDDEMVFKAILDQKRLLCAISKAAMVSKCGNYFPGSTSFLGQEDQIGEIIERKYRNQEFGNDEIISILSTDF